MRGLFPAGSWLPRRSSAGVAREGAFFFARLQGGALGGPGPAVQLGPPPHPPREAGRGRCSGQPRSKLGCPLSGYKDSMQGFSGLGVCVFAYKIFGLWQRLLGVIFFLLMGSSSCVKTHYFRFPVIHFGGESVL
jgi:hypothetical protein